MEGEPFRLIEGMLIAAKAIGAPKGRPAGAQYLRDFVAEVKASGFVAELIERNGPLVVHRKELRQSGKSGSRSANETTAATDRVLSV